MPITLIDQCLIAAPPVCVCDHPRFWGPCNCSRDHVPDECFACHRPHKPEFAAIRDEWRRRHGRAA